MKASIRSSSRTGRATRLPGSIGGTAAALALAAVAAPASSQVVSSDASAAEYLRLGASASMALQSSSEGSALERIMRVQGDMASPAAPRPVAPTLASPVAATGFIRASYSYTPAPPARSAPALPYLPTAPTQHHGSTPDVFGSVAIPVSGTAMSWRWREANTGPAPRAARWTKEVRSLAQLPMPERLAQANSWVNHALQFASDAQTYGEADHWASAREALAHGRGDCEDFAITKLQLLRAAGVPATNLYLVVVRDAVRRSDHALLVARIDDRFLVLDNGADDVLDADAVRDYRPVLTFSAGGAWVHGFRERAPGVMLAANTAVAPAGPGLPDETTR